MSAGTPADDSVVAENARFKQPITELEELVRVRKEKVKECKDNAKNFRDLYKSLNIIKEDRKEIERLRKLVKNGNKLEEDCMRDHELGDAAA
jgi:hypothetical protein